MLAAALRQRQIAADLSSAAILRRLTDDAIIASYGECRECGGGLFRDLAAAVRASDDVEQFIELVNMALASHCCAKMTEADEVYARASGIFGDHWTTPLSRATDIDVTALERMVAGKDNVPATLLAALRAASDVLARINDLTIEHGRADDIRITGADPEVTRVVRRIITLVLSGDATTH